MTVHHPTFDDKRPAYLRLRDIEAAIKKLNAQREELLAELTPKGNFTFQYEGEYWKAAIVQSTTYNVELMPLMKRHPDLYKQITKTMLNKAAVRTLVDNRMWPSEAKDLLKPTQSKPWIKITKLNANGEEIADDEAGVA